MKSNTERLHIFSSKVNFCVNKANAEPELLCKMFKYQAMLDGFDESSVNIVINSVKSLDRLRLMEVLSKYCI